MPASETPSRDLSMRTLLQRFVTGSPADASISTSLFAVHDRHFRRRVNRLSSVFFPGSEKTKASIASLSGGAFASFANEPTHEGEPAFEFALRSEISSPAGFLYFWRGSATILFLLREGPLALRELTKLQRNVRIHLRERFVRVERRGETRWALPEWSPLERARPGPGQLPVVDMKNAGRGKQLIETILRAAEAPLTRGEISAVIQRSSGFAREVGTPEGFELADRVNPWLSVEADLVKTQVRARAFELFRSFSDEEIRLLRSRGFHRPAAKLRSFRDLAAELTPTRSAEHWRLCERRIFERIQREFEREEMPEVSSILIAALDEVPQ